MYIADKSLHKKKKKVSLVLQPIDRPKESGEGREKTRFHSKSNRWNVIKYARFVPLGWQQDLFVSLEGETVVALDESAAGWKAATYTLIHGAFTRVAYSCRAVRSHLAHSSSKIREARPGLVSESRKSRHSA